MPSSPSSLSLSAPLNARNLFLFPEEGAAAPLEDADVNQEFELEDGTVVTLKELLQSRVHLQDRDAQLAKLQTNIRKAVAEGDQTATAFLLKQAGHSEEDIASFMSELDAEAPAAAPKNPKTTTGGGDPQMRKELDSTRQEMREMRLRSLRERVDASVTASIDANPTLGKYLAGIEKERGFEAAQKAYQTIRQQTHDQTLASMHARKDKEGRFSDDWVIDSAKDSARMVESNLRSVIGDPSGLGKSSETDSDLEALKEAPLPKEPKWSQGQTLSNIEEDLHAYNTSVLSKASAEMTSDGSEPV